VIDRRNHDNLGGISDEVGTASSSFEINVTDNLSLLVERPQLTKADQIPWSHLS
jgi:hypothetical protein